MKGFGENSFSLSFRIFFGCVALCFFGYWASLSHFGRWLDNIVYDQIWAQVAAEQTDERFVFIDIDERSLEAEGAWPWPRSRTADLVDQLRSSGASQITMDIIFPESRQGDDRLAESLRRDPSSVSAVVFAFPGNDSPASGELSPLNKFDASLCNTESPFIKATGFLGIASSLAPQSVGHISPRVDPDGIVRATPAIVCHDGVPYASLALAAFLQALGGSEALALEKTKSPFDAAYRLSVAQDISIPVSRGGHLTVPFWVQPQSFKSVSATEVLNGNVDLNGAWVVVGSSAVGLFDRVSTPLAPLMPGALIHLRLLQSMLDEGFVMFSTGASALLGLASLVFITALCFFGQRGSLSAGKIPLVATGFFVLGSGCLILVLQVEQVIVSPSGSIATVFLGTALAMGLSLKRLAFERQAVIDRLSSYLPREFATAIARGYQSDSVDMSEKDAILVAIDVRNFDLWASELDAKSCAALLHHLVGVSSRIIQQSGGSVAHIVGCRMLAVWPETATAETIISCVKNVIMAIDDAMPQIETMPSLPPMAGIAGIEQGTVLMGTYGSEDARGFSVLGDAAVVVNGLVKMTTELSSPCLVGPKFASGLSHQQTEAVGSFLLEETKAPTELFALSSVA